MMSEDQSTISQQLLAAIRESGLSIYQIAKRSGVPLRNVQRFAEGAPGAAATTLDGLAAFFSMRLTKPKFPKPEDARIGAEHHPDWTEAEERLFAKHTDQEVAKITGRSIDAVRQKRYRMGRRPHNT